MVNWWRENVSGAAVDYGRAPSSGPRKGALVGAAVGGVAGGVAGALEVKSDRPYVAWVTRDVPRPELGPPPEEVFGPDTARLLAAVRSRSSSDSSAARSLRYLAHLRSLSPETSADTLSSLYQTIENHFSRDEQARQAMNLVAACVEKHPGARPYDCLAELLNDYNRERSFEGASRAFAGRHGITAEDLMDKALQMELRHTSLLARFGLAGGIAIGAAGGALAGAALGAAVGALIRAARS
jgi:hypothetical protein